MAIAMLLSQNKKCILNVLAAMLVTVGLEGISFADPAVSTTAPDNSPLASATENAGPSVIGVAANFTSTLEEIVIHFKKAYPKCQNIEINQGSSGDLYKRIQEGAPFDLFLSANANYTKELCKKDLALVPPQVYAMGKLAMLSHIPLDNNPPHFQQESIGIAAPKDAPYGQAAVETLKALGYTLDKLKIVYANNAQDVFTDFKQGKTDRAFVSLSQAKLATSSTEQWIVPTDLYNPFEQTAVLLAHARDNNCAKVFFGYLVKNDSAKNIIKNKGYNLKD